MASQWADSSPTPYHATGGSAGPAVQELAVGAFERLSFPMRVWSAAPDWLFRCLGAAFFFGYLLLRLPFYAHFHQTDMPWTRLLVDITALIIGCAYLFRTPAKSRTTRAHEVAIALLGGYWPMLPMFALGLLNALASPALVDSLDAYLFPLASEINPTRKWCGITLMLLGNGFDVWGYATLFRSFSIVPEARELRVSGIYSIVRHPIYLGQMVAQAGVWLFIANLSWVTVLFYAGFVAIQLYRSKAEDRVLEATFGRQFTDWKERTFWFV